MPGVLARVAVAVPDEGALVVVLEAVPGHGDVVRGVRDVEQAVVVVLAVVAVRRQGVVVDPHLRRVLHGDRVRADGLADVEVPHHDVADALQAQSAAGEAGRRTHAQDRGVGPDVDLTAQRDQAAHLDHLGRAAGDRRLERAECRHGDGRGAAAAGRPGAEPDRRGVRRLRRLRQREYGRCRQRGRGRRREGGPLRVCTGEASTHAGASLREGGWVMYVNDVCLVERWRGHRGRSGRNSVSCVASDGRGVERTVGCKRFLVNALR